MAMGRRNSTACGGLTIDYLDWNAPTSMSSVANGSGTGGGSVVDGVGAGSLGSFTTSNLKWRDAILANDDCVYVVPAYNATEAAPIIRFNVDNTVTQMPTVLSPGVGSRTGVTYHAATDRIYWVDGDGACLTYHVSTNSYAYVGGGAFNLYSGLFPMVAADGKVWLFDFNTFGSVLTAFSIDPTTLVATPVTFTITGAWNSVGGITTGNDHTFALHHDGFIYYGSELGVAKISTMTHICERTPYSTADGVTARVLPSGSIFFGAGNADQAQRYNPALPSYPAAMSGFSYSTHSAAVGCNGNLFLLNSSSNKLTELNPNTGARTVYTLSNAGGGVDKWRSIIQRSDNTLVLTPGSGNTFAVVSLNGSAPPSGWQHSPYVLKR